MLPKKKKKHDTGESNNIESETFSLGSNPSSVNQQSISNVIHQTNQSESSDSSPDTENENEGENQNKVFKHPMKTGLNQREQCYSKYVKFRLSGRFHFHLHFIHLAKMVGCVNYAQNREKGMIFGDLKQRNCMNTLIEYFPKYKAADKKIEIQAMITKGNIHKQMCNYEKKQSQEKKD